AAQTRGFERSVYEFRAWAYPRAGDPDQLVRRLDDGHVGIAGGDQLGDVAFVAAELECTPGTKERVERSHHVSPQHGIEVVRILASSVAILLVVVAGAHLNPDRGGTS